MQNEVSVSVVVASHARASRLRWLLNSLEEQHFSERWEAIVVHDYDASIAERVIERHPLATAGRLRHVAIEPGTGSPARQRNLGWRSALGELVAFTDDDCRPEADWLERLVDRARRSPAQIVQGRTRPDPFELDVLRAPHIRTMLIDPVGPFAQTCNILYSRALLECLGGFDEQAITGEDVDLSLRARALGVGVVPAVDAVVNHAIESFTLLGILRENLKWRHLAYLVSRHPELRRDLTWRVFWDGEHLRTAAALVAVAGASWRTPLIVLAAPYVVHGARRRGPGRRARLVATAEIPGQAIRQAAEVLGLAAASARHRTFIL